MSKKVALYIDAIDSINTKKDTSFAMGLEALRRGWELFYFEQDDIFFEEGEIYAFVKRITLEDKLKDFYEILEKKRVKLEELDCILIRKDPPFDQEYLHSTQLLDLASQKGVLVINNPQAIRDFNEKLSIANFPSCTPPTLVAKKKEILLEFVARHEDVVAKPLDGMGGKSIFILRNSEQNKNVILETLSHNYSTYIMLQKYIPENIAGDKRILLINGEPIPYALARVPQNGEFRGNLASGAKGVGVELSKRDYEICKELGTKLKEAGLIFVGIDVIGDYLTEINVTSPTCVRELDKIYDINILEKLFEYIEKHI